MIPRAAIPVGNREVIAVLQGLFSVSGDADEVRKFENELTKYLGAKKTFAFNSGRTALYVALKALNLKPGAQVLVPAYTCPIVFEVVLRLGLKPVLVDVNRETFNVNHDLILNAVTSKTKALIVVHLFGRPCEMDEIMEIGNQQGLYVIEDAAQALGSEYKNEKVGTLGDLAIFSFGPGKSMTAGEGGALVVNNEGLMESIAEAQAKSDNPSFRWTLHVLKNILAMKTFHTSHLYSLVRDFVDVNLEKDDQSILMNCLNLFQYGNRAELDHTLTLGKMPKCSAKVARIQLKRLDLFNHRRILNAIAITKLLEGANRGFIQLPRMDDHVRNTFIRYPILILGDSRDAFLQWLLKHGIDAEKPYHFLSNLFGILGIKVPNAKALAQTTITIPNHPILKEAEIIHIANAMLYRHKMLED